MQDDPLLRPAHQIQQLFIHHGRLGHGGDVAGDQHAAPHGYKAAQVQRQVMDGGVIPPAVPQALGGFTGPGGILCIGRAAPGAVPHAVEVRRYLVAGAHALAASAQENILVIVIQGVAFLGEKLVGNIPAPQDQPFIVRHEELLMIAGVERPGPEQVHGVVQADFHVGVAAQGENFRGIS